MRICSGLGRRSSDDDFAAATPAARRHLLIATFSMVRGCFDLPQTAFAAPMWCSSLNIFVWFTTLFAASVLRRGRSGTGYKGAPS